MRARLFGLGLAFAGLWTVGVAGLSPGTALANGTCQLGHGIQHVVILQFDNVHSERDNPNVPSDLEQMPALRGFITGNGTLLTDDHTVLISHTSGGIISTETGLYPDKNGITVGNSYVFSTPSTTSGSSFSSAFKYWTDPTNATTDPKPTLITTGGKNTPAPWVPYTSHGCDFAGISAADMELENTSSDVTQAFPGGLPSGLKNATDIEGLAIHCSQADSTTGGVCANGETDTLADEPGGYHGYKALFGAFQVNPFVTSGSYNGSQSTTFNPVYDVFAPNANNTGPDATTVHNLPASTAAGIPPSSFSGYEATGTAGQTPTSEIIDSHSNVGFPGFDGVEANNALGYTAAVQEAGVPVTYTYISDVHDDQYDQNGGKAFGPGEAGMEAQLREYNAAFTAFFQRLANDGITKNNTLFLVTVDEGDHFAGGLPLNPGCDGVTTPCVYTNSTTGTRNVGEVQVNLNTLIKGTTGDPTVFDEDSDDAPEIMVKGQPGASTTTVRNLEREMAGMSEFDLITDSPEPITDNIADQQELQILHMINSDPLRTPSFVLFGNDDFFFDDGFDVPCPEPGLDPGCAQQPGGFAWNHGDDQPSIASTWQGWVGPGIQNLGTTASIWTDHTDAQPTILSLTGLSDDYAPDGRAISQIMTSGSTPPAIAADPFDYDSLSAAYKQLDAPFGKFGMDTLQVSTKAVSTSSRRDDIYRDWDAQLAACQARRQPLVAQIDALLNNAAFTPGFRINPFAAQSLTAQANDLITDVSVLDASASPPNGLLCGGRDDHPGQATGESGLGFGPVGPQGPSGPQGPPGRSATIVCTVKVHKSQIVSVTCRPSGSLARSARAVIALSRGTRVVGWGQGPVRRPIALHHRARLRGRYVLTVTVIGGPRTKVSVRF